MTSAIDITKPVYGNPTTQSVRDNFVAAHDEIGQLQNDVVNRVIKSGDTMMGDLTLFRDPQLANHAANMAWVINQIKSTANAPIYAGDYDAAADRILTSGQASIVVGQPLPAAGSANSQLYLTVKTAKAPPSIGNQPPGGVPAGCWLISNGVNWNVYQPSSAAIVAQTVPVNPAISGLPGANVYDALSSVPALYLPLVGGTITGNLSLANNPTLNGHAATKAYVDSKPAGGVTSFNTRTGAIALQQTDVSSVGVLNDVGRNLIHNSMFNIAQRGVGMFATNGYTLDRWIAYANFDTFQFQQVVLSDADRTAIGDEAAQFALFNTFTGNAGVGAQNSIAQFIENIRRLAGKTVTVSFWAAGSNLKLGLQISQRFGSGGSPSADVYLPTQVVNITSTVTRYSVTFTLPSVAGKVFGTNGNNYTGLYFVYSAQGTPAIGVQSGQAWLWGVQLEIGNTVTPLEKPDPQQDLAKCQRFYQTVGCSARGNNQAYGISMFSPTYWQPMRATPTVTLGAAGSRVNIVASPSLGAMANNYGLFSAATASGGDGYVYNDNYNLSADL